MSMVRRPDVRVNSSVPDAAVKSLPAVAEPPMIEYFTVTGFHVPAEIETLARDLPEAVDMVLLDGHKALYARVLDVLAPRLRPGACLVADNADACPDYVRRVRAPGSAFMSVPFADDVELTVKT